MPDQGCQFLTLARKLENTNLDRMYSTNGYPRDSHTGKDVTTNLEDSHRESAPHDSPRRFPQSRHAKQRLTTQDAVRCDEEELYDGEGDRISIGIHYNFASV